MVDEEKFNNLCWHDSNLIEILVDRGDPGNVDILELLIDFHDIGKKRIRFVDCWFSKMELNFGVISNETILRGGATTSSNHIDEIRQRWAKSGADLGSLIQFEIETNSTASIILVVAKKIEIIDMP